MFQVPIYRESKEEYYQYLTERRDREVEDVIRHNKERGLDQDGSYEKYLRENPPNINPDKIAWNYNRIIGWIEFYSDGLIIKADLWFIRAKRVSRELSRVIFDYHNKIGDVTSFIHPNNEHIRGKIRKFLDDLQRGEYGFKLDHYYIDSSLLLRNLEYMDVKKLIDDLLEKRRKRDA